MCLDLAFFFSPCFAGADGGSFTFAPPSGISLPSQGFKAGREALMPKEDELEPDLSTEVRRGTPHKAEPSGWHMPMPSKKSVFSLPCVSTPLLPSRSDHHQRGKPTP